MEVTTAAIQIEQLWTWFGDELNNRKTVHEDISLSIAKGEIVALVGASGCGKTTLLREIMGLQSPSQGKIFLMGQTLDAYLRQNAKAVAQVCGVLFQKGALFSALDVFENIAFPLREQGIDDEGLIERLVFMKLTTVGLTPQDAWLKPAELSGGMIKRVALARALILEPGLLLLDEPTAGLDPITSRKIADLIRQLRKEVGSTILTVTNDMQRAYQIGDRVCLLAQGTLTDGGTPELVQKTENPAFRQFIYGLKEGPLTSGL